MTADGGGPVTEDERGGTMVGEGEGEMKKTYLHDLANKFCCERVFRIVLFIGKSMYEKKQINNTNIRCFFFLF